jgi:heme exporter protein C
VILYYALIGNFFIPLGPGISKVEPESFTPDSLYTFHITAYNAHFKNARAGTVQLWLKSGNDYYCPDSMVVLSDEKIDALFYISSFYQDSIKTSVIDIVANDDLDGNIVLRDALTFKKNKKETINSRLAKQDLHIEDSTQVAMAGASADHITDESVKYVSNAKAKLFKCATEVRHNKVQFVCFPYREILYESIRNTFFHVPMWFTMTLLVIMSLIFSTRYLMKGDSAYDVYAHQAIVAALLFGVCGLLTGSVWARYTWGQFWVNDPKLNGAAIGVVIYVAYLILRGSITDEIKRARISAVYNIFAIVVFLLFIFIMPRLTDSLHPGNGGNPAFSKYDLDSTLRMFFYPAVIGWMLLGLWIYSILIRLQLAAQKQEL